VSEWFQSESFPVYSLTLAAPLTEPIRAAV
jgi:hypothetical protein